MRFFSNSETWFKLSFGVAFVYAVAVAARTARLANRQHGGSLNQLTHEVRWLIAVRAALGLVFYGSLFAWLFRSESPEFMQIHVPTSVRWAGVILLPPVLAFYTWSFRSLGANYRGGVGLYDDHRLVVTGAYRWMRHPIYVSFIGIMLAVLMLSANWLLGLSGLVLVSSIAVARIPVEERELGERFGLAWDRYRRGRA